MGSIFCGSKNGVSRTDLQRAFRDDAWRNILLGLRAVMLHCTWKLAKAVAASTILATRPDIFPMGGACSRKLDQDSKDSSHKRLS
ncbi:hypothetical protein QN277_016429 [Acacia crassicarpa]|uniref:Uncharacterized protein n=1 Tax=Acacia crassicarpa TaxID=499986 RepID=A0AAE1TBH8_9FABA|nr:hypothetical protein QN277_016429 [Acacia crassicarpa]